MAKEDFDNLPQREALDKALIEVDRIVMRKYILDIDKYPVYIQSYDAVFSQPEQKSENPICLVGSNIMLLKLCRVVYDKDESVLDRLTTAFNATALYENASLVMLLKSDGTRTDIYYGTVCKKSEDSFVPQKQIMAFKNNLSANFPGTELCEIDKAEDRIKIVQSIFENAVCVSSVTGIAALKDRELDENNNYVQGLEKLIDALKGKECSVMVIADPVEDGVRETIRSGYEEIYTALKPFQKSEYTINKSNGKTVTDSVMKGVTDTTNDSLAKTKTHTTTKGTNSSQTVGGSIGMNSSVTLTAGATVAPFGVGGNASTSSTVGTSVSADYHYMYGHHEDKSESEGDTKTKGKSKSLSEQNSIANALTNNEGEGLQISYENRSIQSILERIDLQIKRIEECEDFGMYDCGVYFLSNDYATCLSAASTYKSLIQGEKSSAESSHINIWDEENAKPLIPYLSTFNHPIYDISEENVASATASTLVSGRELAIYMGLPKHSISGVPVLECARFGRNILENTEKTQNDNKVDLGCIHHMHADEKETKVYLDKDSITSHVFITGSTGSGKSNTVYQLLNNLCKRKNYKDNDETHFMVIEPAKGEYKNVFGGRNDVTVYGTNPKLNKILRINPFSFPEEIHVLEHIDRLVEIFNVCWPMYAAMPAVLKEAVERSYESAGWNLDISECKYKHSDKNMYPSFVDVLYQINQVMEETKYSSESKGDYAGALTMRVGSLTNGINGQILTSEEISLEDLFDKNVIIDLSRIGSTETKSLLMGLLIIKLQEYRMAKSNSANKSLRHITILEEAHHLLKRTSTEQSADGANMLGKSVEMLASAIAEMRTYGEGFIIVDQSPGLMDMSVIRNTNTKIILRLPDITDRELVGKAASLNDDQIVELAKLKTGVCAVYQNNWTEPVLCHVAEWEKKNNLPYRRESDSLIDVSKFKTAILAMVLLPVTKKMIEDVDALKNQIYVAKITSGLKTQLLKYIVEDDFERIRELRKDIIYGIFTPEIIMEKNLCYRNDIEEWCQAMINALNPNICGFNNIEIDKILSLLAIEKRQKDSRGEYQELFSNLMNYIDNGRRRIQ